MPITIPLVLAGLVAVAAVPAHPPAPHPAQLYAEALTAQLAHSESAVKVRYLFDAQSQTLRVVGQVSQVINRHGSRLLGPTLMDGFQSALRDSLDMSWLQDFGVAVRFELLDRNRTPIQV